MSDWLDPQTVRAPEFGPGEWLNTHHPPTREALRGKVVLVDFWDYTCVNCIRTLPYVTGWHARYADKGLAIVGVHTPEFAFARTRDQIEAALNEFGIAYPVLLDNEYETWSQFANRAWPSKHLIDAEGYIRLRRQGEGHYRATEMAIQSLLRQRDPDVSLPPPMQAVRAEDRPGAVCYLTTPELLAGYEYGALGNPKGYASRTPVIYELPPPIERKDGHFYAEGIWQAGASHLAFAGQESGRVVLPYHAAGVNAVLSPSGDPVEIMLDLKDNGEALVEVRQDGEALRPEVAGSDVVLRPDGSSVVAVTRPRLYELVRHPDLEKSELELVFRANGLALYAFTFTSCVAPEAEPGSRGTYTTH